VVSSTVMTATDYAFARLDVGNVDATLLARRGSPAVVIVAAQPTYLSAKTGAGRHAVAIARRTSSND
jgi:hypothetical protein